MLLKKTHVKISPEFAGDGAHHANLREAVFSVEAQRAFVFGGDDGDDVLDPPGTGNALQLGIQPLPDAAAPERVADELEEFVRRTGSAVLVSDYLYGDAARFDEWTENYRRGLALIDRRLAACCENVLEVSTGQVICHKGVRPL